MYLVPALCSVRGFGVPAFMGHFVGCVVPSWGKQDPVNATSVPKQGPPCSISLPKTQHIHSTDITLVQTMLAGRGPVSVPIWSARCYITRSRLRDCQHPLRRNHTVPPSCSPDVEAGPSGWLPIGTIFETRRPTSFVIERALTSYPESRRDGDGSISAPPTGH